MSWEQLRNTDSVLFCKAGKMLAQRGDGVYIWCPSRTSPTNHMALDLCGEGVEANLDVTLRELLTGNGVGAGRSP